MLKNLVTSRRTDQADVSLQAIGLATPRKPLAGDVPVADLINPLVREAELYRQLDADAVHCYACAHECTIKEGGRGVCQVRYNVGGKLYAPHGYVAALQCDPTEKKPFYHVHPGSDTLTFGMLGCDLHCSYCFRGDTIVTTNLGPQSFETLFGMAESIELQPDGGQIARLPGLKAVAASGEWQPVKALFKRPYQGNFAIIQPYYLTNLYCTADHKIYATDDPNETPYPIPASDLTLDHLLVIPRHHWEIARQTFKPKTGELLVVPRIIEKPYAVFIPIRSVEILNYTGDVYNMEVENEHNYLANFFLVRNCQNWDISQTLRDANAGRPVIQTSSAELVSLAKSNGARCVASSYNEPLITSEWAREIFELAHAQDLTCLYVSNGNATREVLEYIRPYTSGYKIDLKTMNPKNYRKLGAVLEHILDGIRMVHEMGFWLEIVTLLIPGFNDSDEEIREAARFIKSLSPDIPWHVTGFHNDYKMDDPGDTPASTLIRAAEIGYAEGLHFVYAGNRPGRVGRYENTYCPDCGQLLIGRYGYVLTDYNLTSEGACPACHAAIPGLWPSDPATVRLGTQADIFSRRPRAATF